MFAGVASPPRPKAASPAKGLLPSLPICNNDDAIHRSEIGAAGKERAIITRGCALLKRRGFTTTTSKKIIYLCSLNLCPLPRASHARGPSIASKNSLAQGQAHRERLFKFYNTSEKGQGRRRGWRRFVSINSDAYRHTLSLISCAVSATDDNRPDFQGPVRQLNTSSAMAICEHILSKDIQLRAEVSRFEKYCSNMFFSFCQ